MLIVLLNNLQNCGRDSTALLHSPRSMFPKWGDSDPSLYHDTLRCDSGKKEILGSKKSWITLFSTPLWKSPRMLVWEVLSYGSLMRSVEAGVSHSSFIKEPSSVKQQLASHRTDAPALENAYSRSYLSCSTISWLLVHLSPSYILSNFSFKPSSSREQGCFSQSPLFPVASSGDKLIILASQSIVQKALTHFFEIFYKVHSTHLPFFSKLSSCGALSQYLVSWRP